MKVAFLMENIASSGGTERVTTLIANKLAQRGHDVILISLIKGDSFFELEESIKTIYIEKKQIRYISFLKKLYNTRIVIGKIKPDILINVGTNLSVFTFSIPSRNIKIITWEHFIYERNFTALRLKVGLWLAKRYTERIIVLSKKEALKWNYKKSSIINNPRSFTTDLLPDYSSKRAIAIGHLDYNKGFDLLIKAWSKVIKRHPEAILNIYGQGEEEEKLKSLIKASGLDHYVNIRKPIKDIINAYLSSSIYLLSSRSENQPMVLLEAMSCGLPIVAFDCPTGPGEILTNGSDGILINKNDTDQYAKAIISFLDDKEKRIKYGSKGRINVEKYNIDKIMKQWESLFKEII